MKNQYTKSRWILTILVVVWAGVIFYFSAQDAHRSSQTSGRIVEHIIRIIEPEYEELPVERWQSLKDTLSFIVRKGAHVTEYLILGVLLWGWFLSFGSRGKRLFWLPWLTGTVYAATDEFHQIFSEGRSPQPTDVGIDSAGVLCGVLLCIAISCAVLRFRKKRRTSGSK